MAQSWRLHVLHRLIFGNIETIFLSETTRSRALIFDMKHHLVRLYQFFIQVGSLGLKLVPPCEVTCSIYESMGKI